MSAAKFRTVSTSNPEGIAVVGRAGRFSDAPEAAGSWPMPAAGEDALPGRSVFFGPARDFPADEGLYELFARTAARFPETVALVEGSRSLTYRELAERVTALAAQLHALGVGEGSAIGLCFARSLENVVATLAILHAGGAYVPLDPAQPRERLAGMVQDSSLVLILGSPVAASLAWPEGTRLVDPATLAPASEPAWQRPADRGGERACILFTSGSTGRPKGAQLTHRGIAGLVHASDGFAFEASDVVAHISNVAFDAAALEIFGALLHGGRLYIVPAAETLEPAALCASLRAQGVTFLVLTAALFHQFARLVPERFGFLRLLVCGGDALSPAACRAVLESGSPPRTLLNGYGPAEITVCCTGYPVRHVEAGATAIPIGHVLANNHVYLLDAARTPVPLGEKGEIYVGGPKVGAGYAGRPELTAASFFPDPFAGGRMYKTGDLARMQPGGELEFLGRIDDQLKIRGYRVEPAEIEAALRAHPRVGQSKVCAWQHHDADKQLVGYVSARNGLQPEPDDLRQFLHARLPEYSVPGAFVVVEAWPLTPNGKIDAAALPLPMAGAACAYPRTEVETALVELWTTVLGVAPASVEQDFFLAGGHSLLAIQMIARIGERLEVKVPVRQLFETPTVAGLAGYIEEQRRAAAPPPWQYLLLIQRGEAGVPPLFFVPGGWGGDIEFLVYAQLARQIDLALPVYGLRTPRAAAGGMPEVSVEEMAAAYLREVRQLQPHGPYRLGGECVGGIVAYEMARQLAAAGETAERLLLLDTAWPSVAGERWLNQYQRQEHWRSFWKARVETPFCAHLHNLASLRFGEKVRYIWQRLVRPRTLHAEAAPPDELTLLMEYPRRLTEHRPQPYAGSVTLLVAEDLHGGMGTLGWAKAHPGTLEVIVVPGTHDSYIREHTASTAARLRELLKRPASSALV